MPKCFKCNIDVELLLHPFSKREGYFLINAKCHNEEHLFDVQVKDVVNVGFKLEELWNQGVIKTLPFSTGSLYTFQTDDARKEIIF